MFGFVNICLDSLAFDRIFVIHDQYYHLANSIANVDEALNPRSKYLVLIFMSRRIRLVELGFGRILLVKVSFGRIVKD